MDRGRCILVAGLVLWLGSAHAADAPPIPDASRVRIELGVRGDLFASAHAGEEPVRRPIVLDARFEFLERAAAAGEGGVVRRYQTARADIETDGRGHRQSLAADAREVQVRLEGTTPKPFLAAGFLSRDEAELLDVPFDPLLFPGLSPGRPVAIGDSWKISGDVAAGLLAIDTVRSGCLEATLAEVVDSRATIKLTGTVVGAVDGVATRIELTGGATVEALPDEDRSWRLEGPITAIEATVSERREAGWIAPGLDVRATIAVRRSPATDGADPEPAADGLAPPAADRPAGQGRPGIVWQRHRQGRYSAVLDSRWRVVEDGPEGLVLRLQDRGKLVAQCSMLPLPRVAVDGAAAEATVRDDVRRSLGEQFGLITASEASKRADGTQVVRVVAEGVADGRPFRWIHYVLTAPGGQQVAVTFMHEPSLTDQFAAADRELVAGLAVLPDTPARQAADRAAPPTTR